LQLRRLRVRTCSLTLLSGVVECMQRNGPRYMLPIESYASVSESARDDGQAAGGVAAVTHDRSLSPGPWQSITHCRHPLSNYYQKTILLSAAAARKSPYGVRLTATGWNTAIIRLRRAMSLIGCSVVSGCSVDQRFMPQRTCLATSRLVNAIRSSPCSSVPRNFTRLNTTYKSTLFLCQNVQVLYWRQMQGYFELDIFLLQPPTCIYKC